LTVSVDPYGAASVTKYPDKTEYSEGETVQLTANASGGDPAMDNIYIEAESGILSGPVQTGNDSQASGDLYIYGTSSQPKDAKVEYTFEVKESGTYVIWGRSYALSSAEDSYFIVVDGSTDTLTWHLDTNYNSWIWQKISDWYVVREFSLNQGTHTLSVITRDINARLDKVIFSKDSGFQPSGKAEDPSSPNKMYVFDYWSGALSGSTNPATIIMTYAFQLRGSIEARKIMVRELSPHFARATYLTADEADYAD
jgi:hypothetical protein